MVVVPNRIRERDLPIGRVEEPVDVWFDDGLVVGSTTVNAQENHFKGGHPPQFEARSALRLGKLATEARLRLVQGSREWSLVLKAADMSFSGIKIPTVYPKTRTSDFMSACTC